MWHYYEDGRKKKCDKSIGFGWYLNGDTDEELTTERNLFGWYLEVQSEYAETSEIKNRSNEGASLENGTAKKQCLVVEPNVQLQGIHSVLKIRTQIEGNVTVDVCNSNNNKPPLDSLPTEIRQVADIRKFRKLEKIDSKAPCRENLNRIISGDSLESGVLSSILNINVRRSSTVQDCEEDTYNVDDGDAIFTKPFPKYLRLSDFRNENAATAAKDQLPLHLKVLKGYLHDSPKHSRRQQQKVASLWEELNEAGSKLTENSVPVPSADGSSSNAHCGNEMWPRLQLMDEDFSGLDVTWKTLLKTLGKLEEKLLYLENLAGALHSDLLNIRDHFLVEDSRITNLIRRTKSLTKELKEMYYFDNVIDLLSGNIENVVKQNWPFKLKNTKRSENQNLIV